MPCSLGGHIMAADGLVLPVWLRPKVGAVVAPGAGGFLLFLLLLLSMLAAYIANQVALSSKKAELDTLQEQIDQQKTQNEEMQRILSGDSDDVTEWVARDSYNYAAANERIFVDVTGN